MNRGRHKNSERKKVIKLAKSKGALYPEKWNISLADLNNIIEAQYNNCKFNNLHLFETNNWSTTRKVEGGFYWGETSKSWLYWDNLLFKIFTNTNYEQERSTFSN